MLSILFAIFSLPLKAKLSGLKPLTFGWLSECSVTVLLLPLTNDIHISWYLLSPAVIKIVQTLTLDLRKIKFVFYHCAIITTDQCHLYLLTPSLSHCNWNLWTQTLDLIMIGWVFYHCAIAADQCHLSFCHLLSPAASKIVWTQTPDLQMIKWVFYHCAIDADQCCLSFCSLLSPTASESFWTQTLDFEMVRWVFYHCTIYAEQKHLYFYHFLSLASFGSI